MDRSVGSSWTPAAVGLRGPGVSVFGLPSGYILDLFFEKSLMIFISSSTFAFIPTIVKRSYCGTGLGLV